MPRPRLIPATLAAVIAAAGHARAQNREPDRPSGAQRVVRVFDFEESEFNPLPVPLGWIRAQHDPAVPRHRPGFPIWNRGVLDARSGATSGLTAVRLPAEGGSASLRLLPGSIGVFPGADYRVTALVRTERMVHARAALAARLLDQDGRPLPATEGTSALVRTMGEWTTITAVVPGLDDRAAYLQIELLVLQPDQRADDTARAFAVWEQDYHASAWFDDVAVTLLPRLEMDTGFPGQVVPADSRPSISLLIRDLTGEHLDAAVRIVDADGRLVDLHRVRPGAGRLAQSFTPALPGPGWYRAVLRVEAAGAVVAEGELDFAWGAAEDEHARSGAFALRATAVDPERAAALAPVVAWSGVGHATVGVWDERLNAGSVQPGANPAFNAVRAVLDAGVGVTVSLDEAPADLAALIGRDPWDVPGILAADESLWMPWAEQALDRFGQGVLSWQVGDHALGLEAPVLDAQIDSAASVIGRWVPGPEVRTPWGVSDDPARALVRPGRALVIADDGAGEDDSVAGMVESWAALAAGVRSQGDRPALTIEFAAPADGRVSREALGKLARRAVGAWAAAQRTGVSDRVQLALRDPWRTGGGRRPAMMPTPELAVWRTLSSVLGGQAGARELDLLPGVRTILSGSGDEGVLIAWLTDPDAPVRTLELPLATVAVRAVDLLGPRVEVPLTEDAEVGMAWHRVPLSREPVVIEGVRTDLVEFLASVRITPERLDARLGERAHELVLRNPWPFPIRGKVFIVEPGGLSRGVAGKDRSWQVAPRVVAFSVDAGQTHRSPIDIGFGAAQEAGWIPAVLDVQLSADEDYPILRAPRRMELASEDLGIELVAVRTATGALAVDAIVTNRSQEPRSVELAAVAAGASRERATVNDLSPGASVGRRFLLEGVGPGQRVSVGLTEPKTGARLLRSIQAP